MSCKDCDIAQEGTRVYPFRLGNKKIGYGSILVSCCEKHGKLIQKILRGDAKQNEDGSWE